VYSQRSEEKVILQAVANIKNGKFLDIGAYHPTLLSNTRALYELGWSGVMIDPSPFAMTGLLKEYGQDMRVTLVQAAVSAESGLFPMWITEDAESTINYEHYQKWKDSTKFLRQMHIHQMTLEQVFNQFGGFDFISIDAEGVSADLAIRLLKINTNARCICVEYDPGSDRLLNMKMTEAGYDLYASFEENGVFVKR
jgi:FkbM family methyltransferase